MKTGYLRIYWLALTLTVIIAVTLLLVVSDLPMFCDQPLAFILSAGIATLALSVMMHNHYHLPLLRHMKLRGRLLVAPVTLLILTVPAALIRLAYDLNGKESLNLLSGLFISLAVIFFFSALSTLALPSRSVIYYLSGHEDGESPQKIKIISITVFAIPALFLMLLAGKIIAGYDASVLTLMLPLLAVFQIVIDLLLSADFRNALARQLRQEKITDQKKNDPISPSDERGFRSVLTVRDHYLDLISGRLDYLSNKAHDSYAAEIIRMAGRTFDPALIPPLRVIASGTRFDKSVSHEAGALITVIEKYYSDPARFSDLLRKPGIDARSASARALMLGKRKPQLSEISRLLSDPSAEIRRIGLAAAGLFDMKEFAGEAVQALCSPDTEREAFSLLVHFGPESYSQIVMSALRMQNSERVSLMVMRLLSLMPPGDAIPHMIYFLAGGTVSVKLKAAEYLCQYSDDRHSVNIPRLDQLINETIHNLARLIAIKTEAVRSSYFLLSAAVDWDRSMNTELLFSLLSFKVGSVAADMIRRNALSGTHDGTGLAAEIIDVVADDPVRKPLKALLGHYSDRERLNELAACFPLRTSHGEALPSMILSSEQNITGLWTKACALHKVASEGRGINKDLTLSYLFSNTPVLREEAARVIRSLNPQCFDDAEGRLPDYVREKSSAIISRRVPDVSMIFEKTRFLSLCFNKIPEERMIFLASEMTYTDTYDTGTLSDQITWIVPSDNGKSGLYSLSVNDIADFVFHFSEYTDIFVKYLDDKAHSTVK